MKMLKSHSILIRALASRRYLLQRGMCTPADEDAEKEKELKRIAENRGMCTAADEDAEKAKELKRIAENPSIDEPPTTCCMSGCANCVFIVWAEALTARMQTVPPEIAEKVVSMVEDPSLKAYLEMELRLRGLKK